MPVESRAAKLIREILESGRALTYVRSAEEQRVSRVLEEVCALQKAPTQLFVWSLTEGMRSQGQAIAGAASPREALDFVEAHAGRALFHLKDFHEPMRDSADVRRRMRDLSASCLDKGKFVVISSAVNAIPEEVQRDMVYVDLRLPDRVELALFLKEELQRIAPTAFPGEKLLDQFAGVLLGLTLDESRYALRRALATGNPLGQESVPALLEEKRLLVNRSGVLEFIPTPYSLEAVGGLEGLKKWLVERRRLFQLRDAVSDEIVPKGLLMMGIPGCGKSLCVKAIASAFHLPLYRVDMTEIFSGRHGKPEGVFVQACRMMEEMAPAVMWFDELEQGINNTQVGGEQGRIFGFFLTWLQEKTRGLFVAATANRIDLLPAQLIRKGRFDEVFFVDLPLEDERLEIFRIHLEKRGLDPSKFNLPQLLEFTKGWTGSEIEQCVVSAVTRARIADRDLHEFDLIGIAAKTVPLSRTMQEQMNAIRAWAFDRAIKASIDPNAV